MVEAHLLRTKEVAEMLGISEQTVRRLATAGRLPVIFTGGGHRRFRREDVDLLKADQLQRQLADAADASSFLESPPPLKAGKYSIKATPGMSFDEVIRENPRIPEEILLSARPAIERIIQNPAIESAMRLASQIMENPAIKMATSRLSAMPKIPDTQISAIRRAASGAMIDAAAQMRQSLDVMASGGLYGADDFGIGLAENVALKQIVNTEYGDKIRQICNNLNIALGHMAPIMNQYNVLGLSRAYGLDHIRSLDFFRDMTEQWSQAVIRMGLPMAGITNLIPSITDIKISDDFLDHIRSTIDLYAPAFERMRKGLEEDEETVNALRSLGLPLAPSMTLAVRRRIIDFQKTNNKRSAINSIIWFYHKNKYSRLSSAVDEWSDISQFAPRMSIIRDALWAHMSKKYTLSVPALFPIIEGVMCEFINYNGKNQDRLSQKFVGDKNELLMRDYAVAITLKSCLLNNVFKSTNFTEERARRLPHRRQITRHSVGHGVATGYATAMHSLRLFLLLDAIALFIRND